MNSHILPPYGVLQQMDMFEKTRLDSMSANMVGSSYLHPTILTTTQRISAEINPVKVNEPTADKTDGQPPSEVLASSGMQDTKVTCSPQRVLTPPVDDSDMDDDISVGSPESPVPAGCGSPVSHQTCTPPPSTSNILTTTPLRPPFLAPPQSILAHSTRISEPAITNSNVQMTSANIFSNSNRMTHFNPSLQILPDINRGHAIQNLINNNHKHCGSIPPSPHMIPNAFTSHIQFSNIIYPNQVKTEPLDPDILSRNPHKPHQIFPIPQLHQPLTQQDLKFSINNILKPEFGSKRPEDVTSPPPRESRIPPPNQSPGGTPQTSPVSSDSSKVTSDTELWPAWVFCTRYSDRPSAGLYTEIVF